MDPTAARTRSAWSTQPNAISKGETHVNRLLYIAAAGALLVFGASAQDSEALAKAKAELENTIVQMKMVGAVKGTTVKGAPYSGEEVNETNQMLADGTRIHHENRATVYRDSEGRTRRETPDSITITDPVANVTYMLNPKTMTGQKLTMASVGYSSMRSSTLGATISGDSTSTFSIHSSGDGPATITLNGVPLDEKAVAEAMAKAKANGSTQTLSVGIGAGIGSGGGAGIGSGGGAGIGSGGGR